MTHHFLSFLLLDKNIYKTFMLFLLLNFLFGWLYVNLY